MSASTAATLLADIRARDAALHAFAHVAEPPGEPAMTALARLPLGGLPVAVKDIIDTADMPTGYGSRLYDGHRPAMDAAIVTGLRRAGAFIVGKTTTTEFATHPPTATLNPRSSAHTPGGSSAGSAAAVAAGLVPVALGTQTLGSIIRPASYCGVVGFKPTHGWFPLAGIKGLAASLDTVGFLAADVAVTRRVYQALVPDDGSPPAGPPRLLFARTPNWERATPDAQAAIETCVATLRAKGFDLAEAPLPEGFEAMDAAANVIHDYEAHRALAPDMAANAAAGGGLIDATLLQRIERAGRWSVGDYREALQAAERQRAAFAALFSSFDAIVGLAAAGEAPAGLGSTGLPVMNSAWTALHLPCLSLPVMTGATGLPIGLQLVGDRHQDMKLLAIGAAIEAVMAT